MRRFLLKLMRRRQMEQDLEAELAFHREMAARNDNPIPFGNVAVVQEQARDLWRFCFAENAGRDLLYAARGLRRNPGFVAAALLSLGLGIGVNTAMFSLAVEFLMSEPSVRDASSVVNIRIGGGSHMRPEALQFLDESGVFEGVAGEFEESFINWDNGHETRRTFAVQGSPNYFTLLGIPVAHGRGWNRSDPKDVVVLSHLFWKTHFTGDPAVVGRTMRLDGRMYTILGVLPEKHRTLVGYGFSPDLYVPRFLDDAVLAGYARLKPQMSVPQAAIALKAVAERLDRQLPGPRPYADQTRVVPVSGLARLDLERSARTVALFFGLLLVLVGLVLLIACMNVASLLLARASARRQETAIRLSLGASRGRLFQQFFAESLLLSCLGALAGFGLARIVTSTLASIQLPLPIPLRLHIDPDWRVVSYAALLTAVCTIVTGLIPAAQSVRESIRASLQRDTKIRLRRGLVAAQIAVSLIVLTTGSLFLRNLLRSAAISPGFDVHRTVRAEAHLPPSEYKEPARLNAFVEEALQELRSVPGLESAAAARIIPFTDATNHGMELIFPDTGEKRHANFHWNAVSADYFRAMDIPVLAGRPFTANEHGAAKSVIVNKTFVERYAGNRNPIGLTFLWNEGRELVQIVGVVAGTKNLSIGEEDKAQLYQPLTQIHNDRPRIQFVVRSAIAPALQITPVQRALRRLEPNAGIEVNTMYSSIGLAFLPSQVGAALMGSIGVLGLLLAAVGLYGVMAYSVARRIREIGIRVAIGANRASISRMVLWESARLVLIGAVPGLLITLLLTRPLAIFLVPGLSPSDPATFTIVVSVLGVTAVIASLGPLHRALSIDPARSLRYE